MEIKNIIDNSSCHPGQPKKEVTSIYQQTEKAVLKQLQYDTFQKSANE